MFLKNIKVRNYRKFRSESHTNFAYYGVTDYEEAENISKNTTLFVGKNNTGKTSIMSLLSRIAKSTAGSQNDFNVHDINYVYLQEKYQKLLNYVKNSIESESKSETETEAEAEAERKTCEILNSPPFFEVDLEIGIEDIKDNRITTLKDILYVQELEEIGKIFDNNDEEDIELSSESVITTIKIKFEPKNIATYKNEITSFCKELIKKPSDIQITNESSEEKIIDILKSDIDTNHHYTKMEYFNKYIKILDKSKYVINIYPDGDDEPIKQFNFSDLFFIQSVEANLVTSSNALTLAYNQIVKNIIRKEDKTLRKFNISKDSLNRQIYNSFQGTVSELNSAIGEIEAQKNLEMSMRPALTLDTILSHATEYIYIDNGHHISENQFGLGYTNLMLIIAKITEYFKRYDEDNLQSKVNIITIEEPETFMHPQMQENFIKNIESAIAILRNAETNSKVNYQLVISTHSSHILNSKLQTSNTFNSINYFKNNLNEETQSADVISLNDEAISPEKDNSFEFVKKHVQLEMTGIFFADAVIFVEGATEELYIKYLLDKEIIPKLKEYHIKVYKINGAHANMYIKMLHLIKIPTVIITDIDYDRYKNKNENEKFKQLSELTIDGDNPTLNKKITTNSTIIEILSSDNPLSINYFEEITKQEYIKEIKGNIVLFTQYYINDYYATSFEEALILENANEENLFDSSIHKLLDKVYPIIYKKIYKEEGKTEFSCASQLRDVSYQLQKSFNSGHKTKLIHELIQLDLSSDESFNITPPKYIFESLKYIKNELEGD